MSDYDNTRILRDVQSAVSRMDWKLRDIIADGYRPKHRPGEAMIKHVVATIARHLGQEERAQRIETKAAVNPARTDTAGWAQELTQTLVADFILSLQRQSAMAGILAKCPQTSVLGAGAAKVP